MKYSFTIVMPTFKRHNYLFRAIDSLQKQTITDIEILIVNNNIEDGLKEKVVEYNKSATIPLTYLNYPIDGLYGARTAGQKQAKGDVLIYFDDDETCNPDFVEQYKNLFESNDKIVAAGGPYLLRWEETPPEWITKLLEGKRTDSIWGHYDTFDELTIGEVVNIWGGNMALKKSVFEYTRFYPDLVDGNLIGDGESGTIEDIAAKKGDLMAFVPAAPVYHHMPPSKMNTKHMRWSSQYIINTRTYRKFKKEGVSLKTIFSDGIETIGIYWKSWIKDIFYSQFRMDQDSICNMYVASMGYWRMKYLYWLLFNSKIRDFIVNR